MRKINYVLCVSFILVTSAAAQNISRIEYFFNTDPGFGQATPAAGFTPSPDVAGFPVSVNLAPVPYGTNILYVRARDDNGSWSMTNVIPFIKTNISVPDMVRAEYFFNTDPGFGLATPISGFTPSPDVVNFPVTVNLGSVPMGINNLYIRAEDTNGSWSITNVIPFIKADISTLNVARAEYFFNTDPGFGNGTPFSVPASSNISQQPLAVSLASAPLGINTWYIRMADGGGNWSLSNTLVFVKGTVEGDVSSLEYYIDTDPGFGMATPVTLAPGQNISNYNFNADVSGLTDYTFHNLFIRAKDADGGWSLTNVLSFQKMPGVGISEVKDASAAFTAVPNPATDKMTLKSPPNMKMDKIELIDTQGKWIQVQSTGNATEKVIDVSSLKNGIYFIRITSGSDVVYKKVMKD